jgi:hypothetical protein
MNDPQLGEVIGERRLEGIAKGLPVEVTVRIGKPVPHQQADWICPYEIASTTFSQKFFAAGVDSIQALSLAMVAIGVELKHQHPDLKLRWLDSEQLGFPVEVPERR